MQEYQATVQLLRGSGYRLTPQRMMVIAAIGELGGHVTVERIHQQTLTGYPFMDVATVYRTVGLLKRLHVLNEVTQAGVSHYEIAAPTHRHHHMVCEHCGQAIHLPPKYLDELRERLMRDTGFEPHMEHFTISGLCAECQKDRGHSHSGHVHDHTEGHSHADAR